MKTPHEHENAGLARSGLTRLIPRWEYRYLRVFAGLRLAGGFVLVLLGALLLWYRFDGWAALPLVGAALLFAVGYLQLTLARRAPPRTLVVGVLLALGGLLLISATHAGGVGPGMLGLGAPAPAAAPNLKTLTITSAAVGPTRVNVLLPAGYRTSTRRYPVLYLLHGYGGSYADWVRYTDLARYVRRLPLIVVMPDGGTGWYMNPTSPGKDWETYHIQELIPYVDAHFRTIANRGGRAIAGLSMGGMGALSYAARHPDLFVAAASFSGVLDPEHFSPLSSGQVVSPAGVFGSLCANWVWCVRAHSPVALASNLRGLTLFLSAGNGQPGPLDSRTSPPTPEQREIEAQVHASLITMVHALQAAGIPAVVDDYGNGTHNWPYWQRELHRALPVLLAALAKPPAPPTTWSYVWADTAARVWGYTLTVARAGGGGYTRLMHVGPQGFSVRGSGRVSVVTAPIYARHHPYVVGIGAGRPARLRADSQGRLHVVIPLGSKPATATVAVMLVVAPR